jgi:formiminoglutamase
MTNPTITQSQKRFQESVGSQFGPQKGKIPFLFLTSPSDFGVIRNGGRNGARFAPQSFLSAFAKFTSNAQTSGHSFIVREVSNGEEEQTDFIKAQKAESRRIDEAIKEFPSAKICHLGGGHDHVYPLLVALGKRYEQIIVVNVDAHADTRIDDHPHSGTPFRQFAEAFYGQFWLFQVGLHPFANSVSTLSELPRAQTETLWRDDLTPEKLENLFQKIGSLINDRTCVLLSLDADALAGHEMPGVSAVNPYGLTNKELRIIWKHYKALSLKHAPMLGIYELNPLYDTLAGLSMKTLGSFVFEGL